jgi:phenylacetate-coenzyme A ligase PaaK-like adenylate-forming protein
MEWRIESAMPGMALPAPAGAAVLALMYQLEHTRWLSAERLVDLQLRQLEQVLRHARSNVPYYRERLIGERLFELPILTRQALMEGFDARACAQAERSAGAAHSPYSAFTPACCTTRL